MLYFFLLIILAYYIEFVFKKIIIFLCKSVVLLGSNNHERQRDRKVQGFVLSPSPIKSEAKAAMLSSCMNEHV